MQNIRNVFKIKGIHNSVWTVYDKTFMKLIVNSKLTNEVQMR